jgi:formiminoglutamase
MSPSGVSVAQARQFVHFSAADHTVAYLHISEGVVQRADGLHDGTTGKLISYLVADFIKAMTIE